MTIRWFTVFYRLTFSILATVAMVAQFRLALTRADFSVLNFFSYFTIQSNLLAVFVFTATSIALIRRNTKTDFSSIRGALTLYLLTTGIVYAILLAKIDSELRLTIPWVNVVIHQVMPLVVVLDWLIHPPQRMLKSKDLGLWFLFPMLYSLYSLARGFFFQWSPYPFLDPNQGHSGHFFGLAVGVSVLIVVLGVSVLCFGNFRRRTRSKLPA